MNSPATVPSPDSGEEDQTNKTLLVGNREFLLVVFDDEPADARLVMVSFVGDPAKVPGRVWFARPWQGVFEASTKLPHNANNHGSLAVSTPADAGQIHRQKARFHPLGARCFGTGTRRGAGA